MMETYSILDLDEDNARYAERDFLILSEEGQPDRLTIRADALDRLWPDWYEDVSPYLPSEWLLGNRGTYYDVEHLLRREPDASFLDAVAQVKRDLPSSLEAVDRVAIRRRSLGI